MAERILRLPEIKVRTGLSRSSIYALMAMGSFPVAVKLTRRSVGWYESQLDEWIATRRAGGDLAARSDGGR